MEEGASFSAVAVVSLSSSRGEMSELTVENTSLSQLLRRGTVSELLVEKVLRSTAAQRPSSRLE